MNKWTKEQNDVITSPYDADLLVSASAGAGKTSVMIERIASMLEANVAKYDEFLVMTFTNESARDMKSKLRARLGKQWQTTIDQISIGTFHKFCEDLVKTYFSHPGINPAFSILDDGNGSVIRDEILTELIEEKVDVYPKIIEAFCSVTGSKGLKAIVLSIAEFLEWQNDKWLSKTAYVGYETDLQKNIAMKSIIAYLNNAGEHFARIFPPELDCFEWAKRLCGVKSYTDIHAIAVSFDSLKRMDTKSEYYTAKNAINELLKKIREQYALTESQIIDNQSLDRELVRQIIDLVTEYIERYRKVKNERNYLDFSDLERYAGEILDDTELCARINEKYRYIFIDEYQDTNPVQERILQKLSGGRSIFTVGDVKQSIYGFRGTSAVLFTDRMKGYESTKHGNVIYLNQNFRSNTGILNFVNKVFGTVMSEKIAGLDYQKTSMFQISNDNKQDDSVEIIAIQDGTDELEASFIAEKIISLQKEGIPFGDIAILSRNGNHLETLIKILNKVGIRCITDKKQSVSDLFEIELLNNMLLACYDTKYELPAVLLKQSFVFNFSAEDLAQMKLGNVTQKIDEKIAKFNLFQNKYHNLCLVKNVVDVLSTFIAEYNIINMLLITPDGDRRVKNIYAFLNKLRGASYADTVAQYVYMLENNQLDMQIDVSGTGENCVRIMTIHSAKGLEFPVVFLYNTGVPFSSADKRKLIMADRNYGLCVYSTDPDENIKHMNIARLGSIIAADNAQIAEEMRLLYVAMTRAKDKLFIVGSGKAYDNKQPDDFEILSARNYFDFIRPSDTVHADDIAVIEPVNEQYILTGTPDEKIVEELRKTFIKTEQYPNKSAIDMAKKSSVTSLTKPEEDFLDMPVRSGVFEKDRGTVYGTKFHKGMQIKDYFDEKTKKCAEIIDNFTDGMKVYRELVLLQEIERGGEKMLVQGVIDLLAVGAGKAIVVDYKTTRASEEKLVSLYRAQLDMYAAAVQKAIDIPVDTYIYSTVHEKLIRI